MAPNLVQAYRQGLAKKAGAALLWSLVAGGVLAALTLTRPPRLAQTSELPWHLVPSAWLERLELWTYDWRTRELAGRSKRADGVVGISIDAETVQSARLGEHPEWAMRPWPRALVGELTAQLGREGAAAVLLGGDFSDVSAHHCPGAHGAVRPSPSDDARFAARLDDAAVPTVVPFGWSSERERIADRSLTPFVASAGSLLDGPALSERVGQLLAARLPVWLGAPDSASRAVPVWAGAPSEAQARELASRLEPSKPPEVAVLTPGDGRTEVGPAWLLARLAAVEVDGLDPSALPHAVSLEPPVPELLSPKRALGAATLLPGVDDVVRSAPLLVRSGRHGESPRILASAPLQAVMALEGTRRLRYEAGRLRIGERLSVPVDVDGSLLLRFGAPASDAAGRALLERVVPAWRVLNNAIDARADRRVLRHDNELQGKLVVFGDERDDGERRAHTPIGELAPRLVLAQAVANLRAGDGIARLPPELDAWLTLGAAVLGGALALGWSLALRRPGWLSLALTLCAVSLLYTLAARELFVEQQRWIALAAPLAACAIAFLAPLGYATMLERGLRELVYRALGGAVRADVVRRVERNLLLMRPERRALTVCICDLDGFRDVAGQADPRTLVEVLQEYLGEMTDRAIDQGGHVDRYVGDALMAFWGAPVALEEHTLRACEAALALRAHFETRRSAWERGWGGHLAFCAGIDTGLAVVGEMGTHHRVSYSVLGEPVSGAFRLDALAKRYGIAILVTASVRERVEPQLAFRSVDRLVLAAAAPPTELFELLGRRDDTAAGSDPRLERHETAVRAFRERRFGEALVAFEALLAERAEKLHELYAERCRAHLATPPGDDWVGSLERRR